MQKHYVKDYPYIGVRKFFDPQDNSTIQYQAFLKSFGGKTLTSTKTFPHPYAAALRQDEIYEAMANQNNKPIDPKLMNFPSQKLVGLSQIQKKKKKTFAFMNQNTQDLMFKPRTKSYGGRRNPQRGCRKRHRVVPLDDDDEDDEKDEQNTPKKKKQRLSQIEELVKTSSEEEEEDGLFDDEETQSEELLLKNNSLKEKKKKLIIYSNSQKKRRKNIVDDGDDNDDELRDSLDFLKSDTEKDEKETQIQIEESDDDVQIVGEKRKREGNLQNKRKVKKKIHKNLKNTFSFGTDSQEYSQDKSGKLCKKRNLFNSPPVTTSSSKIKQKSALPNKNNKSNLNVAKKNTVSKLKPIKLKELTQTRLKNSYGVGKSPQKTIPQRVSNKSKKKISISAVEERKRLNDNIIENVRNKKKKNSSKKKLEDRDEDKELREAIELSKQAEKERKQAEKERVQKELEFYKQQQLKQAESERKEKEKKEQLKLKKGREKRALVEKEKKEKERNERERKEKEENARKQREKKNRRDLWIKKRSENKRLEKEKEKKEKEKKAKIETERKKKERENRLEKEKKEREAKLEIEKKEREAKLENEKKEKLENERRLRKEKQKEKEEKEMEQKIKKRKQRAALEEQEKKQRQQNQNKRVQQQQQKNENQSRQSSSENKKDQDQGSQVKEEILVNPSSIEPAESDNKSDINAHVLSTQTNVMSSLSLVVAHVEQEYRTKLEKKFQDKMKTYEQTIKNFKNENAKLKIENTKLKNENVTLREKNEKSQKNVVAECKAMMISLREQNRENFHQALQKFDDKFT